MSKPGEMIQILRENYEEQLEAYRLLRNKFLMAVPGMNLDKEKQLYDQWKLDLHLNSIISFDRAISTSPKPCPEDGCPRDGSEHEGCPCEPRTCETCDQVFDWIKKNTGWTIRDPETGEINRTGETYKQLFDIVSRPPQSADVETGGVFLVP